MCIKAHVSLTTEILKLFSNTELIIFLRRPRSKRKAIVYDHITIFIEDSFDRVCCHNRNYFY